MFAFVQVLQLIAGVVQAIHTLAPAVEAMFPGTGRGVEKLNAATSILEQALPVAGATAEQIAKLKPVLGPLISTVVGHMKSSGQLPSSSPASDSSSSSAPAAADSGGS